MNFEAFEDAIKGILQHQDSAHVGRFISECRTIIDFRKEVDTHYTRARDLKPAEAASKHLDALKELNSDFPVIDKDVLEDAIRRVDVYLAANAVLKTGGRPCHLTHGDLYKLVSLRVSFQSEFPHLSGQYVQDNKLHELGELITGKKLPDTTEDLIEKLLRYLLTKHSKSTRPKVS